MKKNLFIALAALTICASCGNDEQEADIRKSMDVESEIKVINGGTLLKFRDMSAYENALLKNGANFEFAQGGFQGFGPAYIPYDGKSLGFAIELGGNETRIFGRKAWRATCLGDFAVWSRGIPYAQRGSSSVKL